MNKATSTKPYMIRAINEWILDNQLTPYLMIDATQQGVYVPEEHVKDGKIILNITPGIVSALNITNEVVTFDARFSGRLKHIYIPIGAVLAIYAKENGEGMGFEPEAPAIQGVVSSEVTQFGDDEEGGGAAGGAGAYRPSIVSTSTSPTATKSSSSSTKKPSKGGKPHLTIVK